ncbi:MAG: hypothetical protein HY660_03845 [Armatimonadetes bacterium]|nr:hypothetical protein [Armatimonadota bacterium]
MTPLTLHDAIAIAGGLATAENCPGVIPLDHFAQLGATTASVGQHFDQVLVRAKRRHQGAIALTMSPSFSCQVRPLGDDRFVLLVPLGMPARTRVLARLLLRYWGRERGVRVIRSALDDVPGDADAVPPLLKPVFLEDFEPDTFWERLRELDASIDTDPRTEPDVLELVHLALVYLLSHEFTHVLHGHFDLLERVRSGEVDLTRDDVRRGIELDADDGAAALSMLILKDDVDRAVAAGQRGQSQAVGWLRLSYVVTMLFAITDAHRKFLGAYERGAYNHPMVRCEFFLEAAGRSLDAPKRVRDTWLANSTEGWKRCVQALDDLNLDALRGDFGKLPEGVHPAPLHTLLYSATPVGVTDRATLETLIEAHRLVHRIREHLPIFRKSPGT